MRYLESPSSWVVTVPNPVVPEGWLLLKSTGSICSSLEVVLVVDVVTLGRVKPEDTELKKKSRVDHFKRSDYGSVNLT